MHLTDDIPRDAPAAPEAVVARVLAALRKAEGTDAALLDILEKRIVRTSAKENAVPDALKDIEALASERAEGT